MMVACRATNDQPVADRIHTFVNRLVTVFPTLAKVHFQSAISDSYGILSFL
jgi:hypothetical protein